MNRLACGLGTLLACFFTSPLFAADKPLVFDVWPGKPAGDDAGKIGEEKSTEVKSAPNIQWITIVPKPALTVYRFLKK